MPSLKKGLSQHMHGLVVHPDLNFLCIDSWRGACSPLRDVAPVTSRYAVAVETLSARPIAGYDAPLARRLDACSRCAGVMR